MTYHAAITRNWQFYIPAGVRKEMGIEGPFSADIEVKGDAMIVRPQKKSLVESLQGCVPYKGDIDAVALRDELDYSERIV